MLTTRALPRPRAVLLLLALTLLPTVASAQAEKSPKDQQVELLLKAQVSLAEQKLLDSARELRELDEEGEYVQSIRSRIDQYNAVNLKRVSEAVKRFKASPADLAKEKELRVALQDELNAAEKLYPSAENRSPTQFISAEVYAHIPPPSEKTRLYKLRQLVEHEFGQPEVSDEAGLSALHASLQELTESRFYEELRRELKEAWGGVEARIQAARKQRIDAKHVVEQELKDLSQQRDSHNT